MLLWTFEKGIESDLESVGEEIAKIIDYFQLKRVKFHIYGFNHVQVEIIRNNGEIHAKYIDEDPYFAHYLDKEEYAEYKKIKARTHLFLRVLSFDKGFDDESEENPQLLEIINSFVDLLGIARKDKVDRITFEDMNSNIYSVDYDARNGISIGKMDVFE